MGGFYKEATEIIPCKTPKSRGEEVLTYYFVDATHTSDKITSRSPIGILISLNRAPTNVAL